MYIELLKTHQTILADIDQVLPNDILIEEHKDKKYLLFKIIEIQINIKREIEYTIEYTFRKLDVSGKKKGPFPVRTHITLEQFKELLQYKRKKNNQIYILRII